MEDSGYRQLVAAAGHAYAMGLKDENRLAADITAEIERLISGSGILSRAGELAGI